MPKIQIKPTKDFALIETLDRQLIGEDADPPSKNHFWWIAEVDGEVAGYAGLGICSDKGHGFLSRAGVLAPLRGMGLQRRLIRVRARKARALGVPILLTYTVDWNMPSANNLIKEGFQLYRPQFPYGCRDAIYFWRNL